MAEKFIDEGSYAAADDPQQRIGAGSRRIRDDVPRNHPDAKSDGDLDKHTGMLNRKAAGAKGIAEAPSRPSTVTFPPFASFRKVQEV